MFFCSFFLMCNCSDLIWKWAYNISYLHAFCRIWNLIISFFSTLYTQLLNWSDHIILLTSGCCIAVTKITALLFSEIAVCMLPFTPSPTFFLRNIFFAIKPDPFRRTKQYRGVAPNNTIASLQTEPLISPNLTHRIIYSDQLSLIIYNSLITPICTCQKLQIIRSLVGVFRSFSKINRNHYNNL